MVKWLSDQSFFDLLYESDTNTISRVQGQIQWTICKNPSGNTQES